ncbi:unnamed protein product [Linum trigynum]|uniref:Uncharacterized protein n=1 Tax=Linum trigynum TaxID=586398 RepID=A0AAV2GDJ7_9ROSI
MSALSKLARCPCHHLRLFLQPYDRPAAYCFGNEIGRSGIGRSSINPLPFGSATRARRMHVRRTAATSALRFGSAEEVLSVASDIVDGI